MLRSYVSKQAEKSSKTQVACFPLSSAGMTQSTPLMSLFQYSFLHETQSDFEPADFLKLDSVESYI